MFHAGMSVFPGGYVGADVFLVIIGFLLTSILLEERATDR
jgi:peptidoglycan/LPS O-acetylase OafA/YrhL